MVWYCSRGCGFKSSYVDSAVRELGYSVDIVCDTGFRIVRSFE